MPDRCGGARRLGHQRLSDRRARRLRVRLHGGQWPDPRQFTALRLFHDVIASILTYDDYVAAETVLSMRQGEGERMSVFAPPPGRAAW